MKKTIIALSIAALLLVQVGLARAISPSEGRQAWLAAKQTRLNEEAAHKQANLDYQKDKTPENDQAVVDTAKDTLHAALDEAEAWLDWKNAEANADSRVPAEIKQNIDRDVNKNIAKIDALRDEVNGIVDRPDVAVVFLKMIGNYAELLTDVARNTGAMWVHIGNTVIDKADSYEQKLRAAAGAIDDNADILSALDKAKAALDNARADVTKADGTYLQVTLPGTPFIKFAEGNTDLRKARLELLTAEQHLAEAFRLILAKK